MYYNKIYKSEILKSVKYLFYSNRYRIFAANFNVMTLVELEKQLPDIREAQGASLTWLASRGLASPIVYRIHRGENYAIGSLLKYIESLHYVLKADGKIITGLPKFANVLRSKRTSLGMSLTTVQKETGWNANQVLAVERGSNFKRSTLLKYIELVKIDLEIVSIESLTPEEQEEFFRV